MEVDYSWVQALGLEDPPHNALVSVVHSPLRLIGVIHSVTFHLRKSKKLEDTGKFIFHLVKEPFFLRWCLCCLG
jgi:hypothetical protein